MLDWIYAQKLHMFSELFYLSNVQINQAGNPRANPQQSLRVSNTFKYIAFYYISLSLIIVV